MNQELKVIDKRMPETEGRLVPQEDKSPKAIAMAAVQRGLVDPEFIERMMDLQDRHEKNEARKAYVKAMAAFKLSPPEILKTKHVCFINAKNQKVEWDHAVLGEIGEAIIKGMSPHGLYHRWDLHQPDKDTVKTTCIITHEMGHSEQISMSNPPDRSGGKDEMKAVASTNTIQQRLTLLALTGLAAKGMDNENPGNGSGKSAEMSKYEEWTITANEVIESAQTSQDLIEWWSNNSKTIKKELSEANAALIYQNITKNKNRLKKAEEEAEREPGEEG